MSRRTFTRHSHVVRMFFGLGILSWVAAHAEAAETVFFNAAQSTLWTPGTTSDTLASEGYVFTATRDKLFTGGIGLTNAVGRALRVNWPEGLEAQAVTAGPSPGKARVQVRRGDGGIFDLPGFTARLLANTAGAGGAIEVMPKIHGEDGLPDPVAFAASGYYGSTFVYDSPQLSGYDEYVFTLYVDFALMRLAVVDDRPPPPVLEIHAVESGRLELCWPSLYADFQLETLPSPPGGLWQPVAEIPQTLDGEQVVRLSRGETQAWFRLRRN